MDKGYRGARIEKAAADDSDMALINKMTLEPLAAEDVFAFRVAMCDNRIDRDFEAFDEKALKQMAGLFVGRTMIKDHTRKSDNQIGRIYACEVEHPGGLSDTGEQYAQLVAKCYVLDNEANAPFIADIKGGIKKEVSVGFRLGSATCSICGIDNMKAWCEHWNGEEYDGKTCYFALSDIEDAYELSFVAVPAQREAGAMKCYDGEKKEKPPVEHADDDPESAPAYEGEAEKQTEIETRMRLMGAFLFEEENEHE